MSARTIQTEEIQSLSGIIRAAKEDRFAIADTIVIDDLSGNDLVTKDMLLDAVGFLYPVPVYITVALNTQLTAVTNEDGESTWAYQVDYTDPQYADFSDTPNIVVKRGDTCNFVPWLCDGTNLDIYLPDYDDTGKTTQAYKIKISL